MRILSRIEFYIFDKYMKRIILSVKQDFSLARAYRHIDTRHQS